MYIIKSGVLYEVKDGSLTEFHSPFAEDFFNQESRSWELDSWKHKGAEGHAEGPGDMGMIPRSMIWGGRNTAKAPAKVKFGAVFAAKDRLYYVLEMSKSSGLFYYDRATDQEIRIFHRTEFQPHGLFVDDERSILTTVNDGDGATHIVQYDPNGKRDQVLTSGDCRDENPFKHGKYIYYQSAGLARNAQGVIAAHGNTCINRLDPTTGDVDVVHESDKFDYLLPRVAPDGGLYCIQTPYRPIVTYGIKNLLLDIVLFPWRLLVAIFGFLNVFSMFFGKKPLTTAGGPNGKQVDVAARIMHNRMVNLEQTWKQERKKVAVSKDWKLMKSADGALTEIASNVLWFDLDESGTPVYTDGYSLFDSDGKRRFQTDDLVSCLTLDLPRSQTVPAQ